MIYHNNVKSRYRDLFEQIFQRVDVSRLHSVTLGLPKSFYRNVVKLYPDEPLFTGTTAQQRGMVSYTLDTEREMANYCRECLLDYIPLDIMFAHAVSAPTPS